MIALQIRVFGIVQGVAFRHFTRLEAERIGVRGSVQNFADGSVYIWVEGKEESVMQFLRWCHHGPDSATVDSLEYEKADCKNMDKFEIIR